MSDYKMQLAIIQNPHTKNPRQLWKEIERQLKEKEPNEEFDSVGFERLKDQLSQSPRFIVK